MPIRNPAEIASEIKAIAPGGRRLLGLDLGEKTIGLALSDPTLSIASPLSTLKRGKFTADAHKLFEIMAKENICALVIGLPINMDGSEGPKCQSARQFAANLLGLKQEVEIFFWDERLSTAAVTRTMLEADLSRRRQKEVVDKMAASYILQGFLDRLRMA